MKAIPSHRLRKTCGSHSESISTGQRFHQMKMSLRRRLASDYDHEVPLPLIRRAMDEAERMALASGFPHLFFPELASEQVRRVATALHGMPTDSVPDRASIFAA